MAGLFSSPKKPDEPAPDRREALRRRALAEGKRPRSLLAARGAGQPALSPSPGTVASLVAGGGAS